MRILRRTFVAATVWLTAVTTVVADLPHLECRCPDGRVKPFCLAAVAPGCCCAGSCCQTTAGTAPVRKACCSQSHRSSDRGPSARSTGCTKSPAPAPAPALEAATAVQAPVDMGVVFLPADLSSALLWGRPVKEAVAWLAHPPAPPADLVTRLARLLI